MNSTPLFSNKFQISQIFLKSNYNIYFNIITTEFHIYISLRIF